MAPPVPFLGAAATGTAARVGGSGVLRGIGSRISGFLRTPSGAATGGFLAGDWFGASRGQSIIGDAWDSITGVVTPTGLIIGAVVVVGVYIAISSDTIAFGGDSE